MRSKKYLSIITILLISNCVLSQVSRVYTLEGISEFINCNIYLYNEGVYEVTLEDFTEENPKLFVLSYGNYSLVEDKLIFSDRYNGYKMQFLYKKEYLEGIKTFKWLQNKRILKSHFEIYDKPFYIKANFKPLNESRLLFAEQNKTSNAICFGTYKMQRSYMFKLDKDSVYQFKYKDIIISEGTWKRKQNELVLFDNVFKYPFYILIGKDKLENKILPGDFNIGMTKIR